ncbi:hypothetical protein PMIN06_003145 [Paraphaeosphaeria minitans]
MNPHISLPRPTGGPSNFGSTPSSRRNELRMPRFFKRLFKFPQMDFEMAIWEMMSLMIAPKKVFRSIYYHKQTSKTYHRPDPSFTYLLSAFQLLTSLAWGFAYASSAPSVLKITLVFIFVHFLLSSLVISTLNFFLIKYLLGPNSKILPGKRRGLYDLSANEGEGKEELEFGYCWDVAIRAFVPVWVFLYVVQFLCMPLVGTDHWWVRMLLHLSHDSSEGYFAWHKTNYTKGLPRPLQHALPRRADLLLHNHLSGLQRAALLAPHRASPRPHRRHCHPLVR